MALPPAHSRLEEWRSAPSSAGVTGAVGGLKLPAHLLPPNAAALRLQLRYQKYQEKVRALLKKSGRLADGQQQQDPAAGVVKGGAKAAGGRNVTGSSMALALALKARHEGGETNVEHSQQTKGSALHVRTSRHDHPSTQKWSASTEWPIRPTTALEPDSEEDAAVSERNSTTATSPVQEEDAVVTGRETEALEPTQEAAAQEVEGDEQEGSETGSDSGRQHGFVNVMESSWLLSSVEQRCAETASSLQSQSSTIKQQPSLALQLADVRLAMLDLLFICRAGVGVNLHGRPPSPVAVHHRNLVSRITEAVAKQHDTADLSPEDLKRVTRIFETLKSDMVMPAVRCLGWLLTKTWRLLFHGLHVDLESLHHVRRVLEAAEGDVSVVFAPTHKTHLDYLIISYLCFAYGIPLPRIAAGNNLDLPFVGAFLRANGSFFIRRSFRNDQLYKQVLEQYVHELLRDGNPVEVFIEGGRSRHGRVCKPRMGFLSMFLDYVKQPSIPSTTSDPEADENTDKTVLVVPISLDYDKVFEVEEYANQLLGKPKEKESLAGLFRSVWDLIFLRCGHSYVRFGEPVPLTAASSLEDVAQLVSVRMQTSGTITATSIVSALLMWKRAYVTEEMLEDRTVWLVEELEKRAATVAHVENDDIVAHALSILKVATKSNGVVAPHLQYPVRALELGFYRNHLLHIFLPEMAIIGALDAMLRQPDDSSASSYRKIELSVVQQQAHTIWRFLRHICRHDLVDVDARVMQFIAEASECEMDEASTVVLVDVRRWRASKLVGFLLSLHWSFMDSLWLSTQGLWSLLPAKEDDAKEHTERDVVRRVQVLAKELFLRQQLAHAEALCSESIKQSLDFLVESGVVRYERSRDGKARVLRLCATLEEDEDEDPVRVLEELTRDVNARRKPQTYLWRQDKLPRNLTRQDALQLMEDARGTRSIYAKWMAPPVASSTA
ncbi:hypothetical protein BBJ28_00021919 [Nothophytophthora sp. Chile5]|nr:hypothetical protein BBJ28_00021919 [Nothophytophthora sp. Chile5]